MRSLTSISLLVLLVVLPLKGQTTIAPCKVGAQAPAFGFWTWAPNSTIKVYVLKADFKPEEVPYLLTPLNNWNAVSVQTGSGVKFEYAGEVTSPLYCEGCLTIMRGNVFDKTKRHATELRTYSARRDQIMTWAHIVIDFSLKDRQALTNAVAHELGHNFGLLDCYSCRPKTTVMLQFKEMNSSNDMSAPTECDVRQVRAAYADLAVRVRSEPQKPLVEDEGEEPVDDASPIVLKKP